MKRNARINALLGSLIALVSQRSRLTAVPVHGDYRMSDDLERNLISTEMSRQRGLW